MNNLNHSRMLASRLFAAGMLLASAGSGLAAVYYVAVNSANPTPPYTYWTTAATNIQDAVDAAVAGDEVVVTNGIYATGGRAVYGTMTNRVAVDKSLTLRSVNGPQFTIIQGYRVPGTTNGGGAIRCVYLTNGASLSGFTLTKGATRVVGESPFDIIGGGVWCESPTAMVSNCLVVGNSAYDGSVKDLDGGSGGGAYGGTLNDCTLTGNSADGGGGAAYSTLNDCTLSGNSGSVVGGGAYECTLNHCVMSGNSGGYYGGDGAGASTLNNCTLTGNSALDGGGARGCLLNDCTLTDNSAGDGGGAYECTLNTCALAGNSASFNGGGGAFRCTLNNCTLNGNSASGEFGYGGGAFISTLNNCIAYYNSSANGMNYDSYSTLNYCCTTPQPTNGVGNITNAPLFVDQASGNLRLQSNSPCINAGLNALAPAGPDLDGNSRIVRGTVDIGAYEYQGPGSVISYAWLQQFSLPTDGSADTADPDGDGLNNWQEWRCGTDPTNALSVLRLLAPAPVGAGLVLRWESVADRTYFLERSATASSGFTPLATGIAGQPGNTAYTDTNVIGAGPWFYRVGVGQ